MSLQRWERLLCEVIAIPGVRGAALVASDDGLVVAEAAMDQLDGADVAALVAALVSRATRVARSIPTAAPRLIHLAGDGGTLLAVDAGTPLWLVAVAEPGAEVGRLRVLLGDLAGAVD
ncbi:MAG: roadblock/LC7 domain-containing protein [Gemmatimonadales bacterium]|nr:roadblock/LC7 domain-containing protein [Gemmatimonadales bacterium]MBP6572179.1 roadblock/LC7 domain-containing protein [Gemmatimonadales bacterium]MBP7620676.1 roadblock/LC7 domain-containing protein [Gemmatimonadales bacterium]